MEAYMSIPRRPFNGGVSHDPGDPSLTHGARVGFLRRVPFPSSEDADQATLVWDENPLNFTLEELSILQKCISTVLLEASRIEKLPPREESEDNQNS